ncbi:MAG: GNAT family N-acetyltransferase [Rhodobacteraceae bacterium]|nr:GNAT family N-acetyltransferase [Paracoccaceae bacterium]
MDSATDGINAKGEDGELLGVALARTLFEDAELLTLAVSPDKRKRGVGAVLLRAIEDAAIRRGAERMLLEVEASAKPALGLYSTFGYAQIGHRRGYFIDSYGRSHDAQILAKLLTELD